ncbi:hypothetical protein MRX96_013655 [Rhipicephalus microplus]
MNVQRRVSSLFSGAAWPQRRWPACSARSRRTYLVAGVSVTARLHIGKHARWWNVLPPSRGSGSRTFPPPSADVVIPRCSTSIQLEYPACRRSAADMRRRCLSGSDSLTPAPSTPRPLPFSWT